MAFTVRRKVVFFCLLLAIVRRAAGQGFIGNALPCQDPSEDPDSSNPRDNLSCPRLDGELQCYSRDELCNGIILCTGGADEGVDFVSLECDIEEFVCSLGLNIPITALCDGRNDCVNGDDESTTLCENKCLLPYYGGCPHSRDCITAVFDVNCGNCLAGFFSDDRDGPCLFPIGLEFSIYSGSEVDQQTVEICAVFVADTSQLINGIAGIFQDPIFDVQPVMGTITPQMTGSATANADYSPQVMPVFLDENNLGSCIEIAVIDDLIIEGTEMFGVVLQATSSNAFVVGGRGTATVSIVDNDQAVQIGFEQSVYEVQEEDGEVTVFVRILSGELTSDVEISFITEDSVASASAPGDYTILSRTLTFGLITTRLLVVIDINNDDIVESIESFFVNLMLVSVGANVVVNTDRTEIRILDNDAITPEFELPEYTVPEPDGPVEVCVTVPAGQLDRRVIIPLLAQDQTATGNEDFGPIRSFDLEFEAGSTRMCIDIDIIDDRIPEDNEIFIVAMIPSPEVFPGPETTVTIRDNDVVIGFERTDYTVGETDGQIILVVRVLEGQVSDFVILSLTIRDDTAVPPEDYISVDESLTFVPGETTIQIPITITEDNIDEESELFIATLSPESVASNDDLTVSPNLADVVIVDVAPTVIGFEDEVYTVTEGDGAVQVFVTLMSGELTGDVTIQLATEDSRATSSDYTSTITGLIFGQHRSTRRPIIIDITEDGIDEELEDFFANLVLRTPAANVIVDPNRTVIEIIDNDGGFCSSDEVGLYMWPETRDGMSVSLPCLLDSTIEVTRDCLNGGVWDEPADAVCSLLEETNEDNLDENNMNAVSVVQQEEQTGDNARLVRIVIMSTAMFVENNISLVDEELVRNVVEVLDGLQQWPADAVQADDNGAEIVKSFEIIAIHLALQENFIELTIMNENIAVSIQSVDRDDITAGISISVSEGEGSLIATIGNDSTLAPDEIASGFLPLSLFELFDPNEESIPIVLAVLRSGSLFSIEGNQGDVEGLETLVGSPVVSLTAGVNRTFINLPDPVIVNVRILVPNFTNPRCVSYDFDQQVWVTDGCTTIQSSDKSLIICECDHLTNFASLVDICSRTEEGGCGQSADARLALDVISIIGVILSGLGLILTILTLLLFNKLRKRDVSKFHIQLSLALLGMLIVFAVGIDRTDVFEGCVTVSVLIHYFTLVAVMWMGAEAVLMFQKLVVVFAQITTRYIIIVSLVCWLVPIIPAVIPAIIDPDLMITDTDTNEFCFIGDVRVFFAAFLGPIFAVLLFNLVTFIIVIVVLIRHTRNKLGKTTDARKQRKSNIRLAMSLFGIMILFGLTWVLGAFTISEASLTFQILFAIFNSLQGFFIFIFFCVLNKDVRQLWLERVTCGRYVKSKSSYTSGGKKDLSTGQLHSGVKQKSLAGTTSTGLSSLPSSKHAADSFIELSEYPSSTVIDNEFSVSTMEKEHRGPPPQLISQPPTSSHAHFFKNPAVEGEVQATRGTSKLGAYESMRATMDF